VKRRLSLMLGVVCLLGAAAVVNATTVVRMDTPELVARAQLVVQGTVVANEVVYEDGPNGPANVRTVTTIEVTESFKGDAGTTVKVAGFGGQVGDLIYKVPGTPTFNVGDEAILMLSKPAPNQPNMKSFFAPLGQDGSLMVTGFSQGHLRIEDGARGKTVVRSDEGLEFAGAATVDTQTPRRSLSDAVNEIRTIVEVQRAAAENAGGGK